jgi:hypothetical protein
MNALNAVLHYLKLLQLSLSIEHQVKTGRQLAMRMKSAQGAMYVAIVPPQDMVQHASNLFVVVGELTHGSATYGVSRKRQHHQSLVAEGCLFNCHNPSSCASHPVKSAFQPQPLV